MQLLMLQVAAILSSAPGHESGRAPAKPHSFWGTSGASHRDHPDNLYEEEEMEAARKHATDVGIPSLGVFTETTFNPKLLQLFVDKVQFTSVTALPLGRGEGASQGPSLPYRYKNYIANTSRRQFADGPDRKLPPPDSPGATPGGRRQLG